MPRSDLADITVVLDRSGSMGSVKDETISGFNHFLAEQKAAPGAATLTLVQFDTEYEFVHRARPIADVPPLTRDTFVPRGMTALLDAMGRAINEAGVRLSALPDADRPGKVIFVILTDGLENSSREFDRGRVNEMIRLQRESYSWEFLFLGAGQDAIAEAAKVGIPAAAAMTYASNPMGTDGAYKAASAGILRSRSGGAVGFTDEEREAQRRAGVKH